MGRINWSINGKNFDDFGIKVSASRGLADDLKQKERQGYNWPGRHGKQYNLVSKPRYEERTIELDCFIEGHNWESMVSQFNSFSSEFDKPGTQRFLVEIFSYKPRVYDVILADKTVLNEVKKEGKNYGTFTVKLTEPEPVKKILYTVQNNLQLSFNTPGMVIVNIDGKTRQVKGNIGINETLPNRIIDKGLLSGRNYLINSSELKTTDRFTSVKTDHLANLVGHEVVFSFDMKTNNGGVLREINVYGYQGTGITISDQKLFKNSDFEKWEHFSLATTVVKLPLIPERSIGDIGFYDPLGNNNYSVRNVQLEIGNKASDWKIAPEDQHYISIAGNIDEITNLNTNATILWERL